MQLNLFWHGQQTAIIIHTDVAEQASTFAISDTNLYVPVVTLSTQDNA